MNKRRFLKTTAQALLGIPFIPSLLRGGCLYSGPHAKNWLWLYPGTRRSDDEWRRLLAQVKEAGIDAILPEVFNGEQPLFAHPSLPARGRVLERLLPLAHEAGLEVHAWMWTLNINSPIIVAQHPDWYAVNGLGQPAHLHPAYVPHYKFLCPRREEVRAFVQENVAALARIDTLDGIHLDYVRLPDVILARGLWAKYGIVQDREYPAYDYCYCAHCRAAFRARTGVDPLVDLADPAADAAWRQFRYDGVTELVNDLLAPAARQAGKTITAAVFPNWRNVRQEWPRWQLDGVLPMLYHSFYAEEVAWIGEQTHQAREQLNGTCPVFPGLYVPALSTTALRTAVDLARSNGASGVALFSHRALTEAHWQALGSIMNDNVNNDGVNRQ